MTSTLTALNSRDLARAASVARRSVAVAGAALLTAVLTGPLAGAQTLDTDALNTALKEGLEKGRDAGKQLTCTSFTVFLAADFVKFIFGGIFIVALCVAAWGWYSNQRGGANLPRMFFIIVIGIAVLGIVGILLSQFMGCGA